MSIAGFSASRSRQIIAWAVFGVFLAGFFHPLVGIWTGTLLGLWFVGTQSPLRGFLWQLSVTLIPNLLGRWKEFLPSAGTQIPVHIVSLVAVAAVGLCPYVVHRLLYRRLPGFLSTMVFPCAGAVTVTIAYRYLPAEFSQFRDAALQAQKPNILLSQLTIFLGIAAVTFFVNWFVSVLLWMWNREFRLTANRIQVAAFFCLYVTLGLVAILLRRNVNVAPLWLTDGSFLFYCSLLLLVTLTVYGITQPRARGSAWSEGDGTLAILRSPYSGLELHPSISKGKTQLSTDRGETFPIQNGIPNLVSGEDLAGLNGKYNRLYKTIAGFYDDTQRIFCALSGIDRDAYVRGYLHHLEVKAGDRVLETSIGTGLNFKYLPREIDCYGVDLSAEMLHCCQNNFIQWAMPAKLFLCNAESLPFADDSFDVVFHVGGINFFSDKGKAIREMIRVAKPGTLILIADESEELVKSTYERTPGTRSYFKGRTEKVIVPIDLIPTEMLDIRVNTLNVIGKDRFYALTFRKPPVITSESELKERENLHRA